MLEWKKKLAHKYMEAHFRNRRFEQVGGEPSQWLASVRGPHDWGGQEGEIFAAVRLMDVRTLPFGWGRTMAERALIEGFKSRNRTDDWCSWYFLYMDDCGRVLIR